MVIRVTMIPGQLLLVMIRGLGKILARKSLVSSYSILMSSASYFRKFERFIPDPEQPDIDRSQKGSDGPVRVGYFSYISEASKAFVKACVNLKIPFSNDFNTSAHSIGVNRVCLYRFLDDGRY